MSFFSTLRNAGRAYNFGKSALNTFQTRTRQPGYQAPNFAQGALGLFGSLGKSGPFTPRPQPAASGPMSYAPKPVASGPMTPAPTGRTPLPVGGGTPTRPSGVAPGPMSIAPTPSSINTALSGGSSTQAGGAPNPYADYLAQEQALIQSGNKQQAIQNSQTLNGAGPTTAPTPTTPTTPSSINDPSFLKNLAQSKLEELQQKYLSTLTPSEKEKALQSQLTDYLGNAQLGISGIEGQGRGIPLALVRGQQSKLQEQANIGAQTLEGQLANETANRTAQGQVYGTQLGYEQQNQQNDQAQAAQQQDFQVKMLSAGYQAVDPSKVTDPNSVIQIGGQTFLKPSPESKVHEVGGNLVDETGKVIYQGPGASTDLQFIAPTATFGGGTFDKNTGVFTPLGTSSGSSQYTTQRDEASRGYDLVNTLLNSPGLSGAVGLPSPNGLFNIPGTPAATFRSQLDTLKAMLSLENISKLKGTGAISDREEQILSNAASSLSTKTDETTFRAELQRVQQVFQTSQTRATLLNSGFTPQQVDDYLNSGGGNFSKVGGDTNQAVDTKKVSFLDKVKSLFPIGKLAGECGHFVNQLAHLAMGDTIQSKLAYVDKSIKIPKPGDVFVMPYAWTGHTGFVDQPVFDSHGTYKGAYVIDSNFHLNKRVDRHFLPASEMIGFARPPLSTNIIYS